MLDPCIINKYLPLIDDYIKCVIFEYAIGIKARLISYKMTRTIFDTNETYRNKYKIYITNCIHKNNDLSSPSNISHICNFTKSDIEYLIKNTNLKFYISFSTTIRTTYKLRKSMLNFMHLFHKIATEQMEGYKNDRIYKLDLLLDYFNNPPSIRITNIINNFLSLCEYTNEITIWGYSELRNVSAFKNASKVILYNCKNLEDISAFTNMAYIEIHDSNKLTNIDSLRNASVVKLEGCNGLTNIDILDHVNTINISESINITDVSKLTHVSTLDIYGCYKITDISMLPKNMKLIMDQSQYNKFKQIYIEQNNISDRELTKDELSLGFKLI